MILTSKMINAINVPKCCSSSISNSSTYVRDLNLFPTSDWCVEKSRIGIMAWQVHIFI